MRSQPFFSDSGFLNQSIREVANAIPAALFVKDRDCKIIFMNRACEEQWGMSFDDLHGTDASQFFPPEQMEWFLAKDREVFAGGRQIAFEEQYWNAKLKQNRIGQTFKNPIYDSAGKPLYLVGITIDITERKRLEASMKLASLIYQSSSEGIVVTDEKNRIVDVNAAFTRITGYELAEIKGRDPKLMQSGIHGIEFYQQFWHAIHEHGSWQGEIWDRRKDGQLIAKWVNVSVIRNQDGSVYRYVAQFSDITEKKQKEELIWRQANFDQLTDLPNRHLFRDRLEQEIKKTNRTGLPLALLFIDLDHFKEINDTLGHDKGDVLLAKAAQRIRRWVRETDTIARLGGDEFTVIIPEFGSMAIIERIAQHIIQELSAPFDLGSDSRSISASIGITIYPSDALNLESLLKYADQAMYLAKERGRNQFAYFSEVTPREGGA